VVKERVQIHSHSPSRTSWPTLGWPLHFVTFNLCLSFRRAMRQDPRRDQTGLARMEEQYAKSLSNCIRLLTTQWNITSWLLLRSLTDSTINKPYAEKSCLYERSCTWIPVNWTLKRNCCITNFCKNVSADRKLKWAQTLRPRWFHVPNVLACGKYDTLQIPYISHVHSNQRFWTYAWAQDKFYNIYWLYSWQYIFRVTNTARFERIKRWYWGFKSSATWRFVTTSLDWLILKTKQLAAFKLDT